MQDYPRRLALILTAFLLLLVASNAAATEVPTDVHKDVGFEIAIWIDDSQLSSGDHIDLYAFTTEDIDMTQHRYAALHVDSCSACHTSLGVTPPVLGLHLSSANEAYTEKAVAAHEVRDATNLRINELMNSDTDWRFSLDGLPSDTLDESGNWMIQRPLAVDLPNAPTIEAPHRQHSHPAS